jgi:hypothetical protein
MDAGGRVIRELEAPGLAGLNELTWDFRHDPPYVPEPGVSLGGGRGGFGGGTPSGPRVQPGEYTIRLTAGDEVHSTVVTVRADPRVRVAAADLDARQRALFDIFTMQKPAYESMRGLSHAQERVRAVQELLGSSGNAALRQEADTLMARIAVVRSRLNDASRATRLSGAIEGVTARPTSDQLWQIDDSWNRLPAVIEEVNGLITRELQALTSRVYAEAARPEPLQPVNPPLRRSG